MNANTGALHHLGQRLWLDNITRELLANGTLARYIAELSITGLTSNPTIFERAIGGSTLYDESIREFAKRGLSTEEIFFQIALQDLRQAADVFRPMHDATNGVEGWVSLEVSPLLARDTANTIAAASRLHAEAARPNLFIKIPGTPEGLPAIEETIFNGVPVNVTLLFSSDRYRAAAGAYMRGIERRIAAGLNPRVLSVASVFVSRWDALVHDKVPAPLQNRLGLATAMQAYVAYREILSTDRWQALAKAGAMPQRLLWASTGTKDPNVSDTLYVSALAAPDTINTLPEKTLLAFADHGVAGNVMSVEGAHAEHELAEFARAGVDVSAIAAQLQREGVTSFEASWNTLMGKIKEKSATPSPAQ
ncbi:MAG: transaldolase [Betaproteobacteria bacterium]